MASGMPTRGNTVGQPIPIPVTCAAGARRLRGPLPRPKKKGGTCSPSPRAPKSVRGRDEGWWRTALRERASTGSNAASIGWPAAPPRSSLPLAEGCPAALAAIGCSQASISMAARGAPRKWGGWPAGHLRLTRIEVLR